jgi:hypothetical protein
MPPCRRSSSGYRGVRARSNGTFYAEIHSSDERFGLGTFETVHEAARAYDAIAWRLGRSRRSMNFDDVWTRQQAEALAPPPSAVTREQRQCQRELEHRLLIAEHDERLLVEWTRQFPKDVAAMEAFYNKKEEDRAAAKATKKAEISGEEEGEGEEGREEGRGEEKWRRTIDDRPLLLLLRVDIHSGVVYNSIVGLLGF